jgi:hypothetical protein
MQNPSPLDQMDALLAQHPFGNSDYVHGQLHICYKRRLDKIATHLPVAGRLLDDLGRADSYTQYRVIGDTVVRCAVQHALRQIETGTPYGLPLEECEELFETAVRHLEDRKSGGPLAFGLHTRLGAESYYGWLWSEERSDDAFARSFRRLVRENYGENLCTPSAAEVDMLTKGARLLSELLPLSSSSALSHAQLIAVFAPIGAWGNKASSSQFRIGGTFFISRTSLSSPWWVAEHLFHEALHQQLYDFRHGHSLLEPTFGEEKGPRVCALWNLPDSSNSNYWDTHRVLAAFHVYVHLALLSLLAEERAPELRDVYGPLDGSVTMTGSRKALGRARYLAEQLREVCWSDLGLAGQQVVDWFSSVLDALDPCPPPRGSYVHLLFDRYRREAKAVGGLLSNAEQRSSLSHQLTTLADKEVRCARGVLAAVDEVALGRLNDAIAQFSGEELGTHFPSIRNIVSETLLKASSEGYGWMPAVNAPDEMIKHMVDSSSQSLMSLLNKNTSAASS